MVHWLSLSKISNKTGNVYVYLKLLAFATTKTVAVSGVFHFWMSGRKRPRNFDFVTHVSHEVASCSPGTLTIEGDYTEYTFSGLQQKTDSAKSSSGRTKIQ